MPSYAPTRPNLLPIPQPHSLRPQPRSRSRSHSMIQWEKRFRFPTDFRVLLLLLQPVFKSTLSRQHCYLAEEPFNLFQPSSTRNRYPSSRSSILWISGVKWYPEREIRSREELFVWIPVPNSVWNRVSYLVRYAN